jgi:hypothetical protein
VYSGSIPDVASNPYNILRRTVLLALAASPGRHSAVPAFPDNCARKFANGPLTIDELEIVAAGTRHSQKTHMDYNNNLDFNDPTAVRYA